MPSWMFPFLFLSAVVVLGVIYFRYALLDHRYPDVSASSLSVGWNTLLVVVLVIASNAALNRGDFQRHLDFTLMILGALTAPAIAPPAYIDKRHHTRWLERVILGIRDRISQMAVVKLVALALFALLIWLGESSWALVLMALCALLLFAKGAAALTNQVEHEGRAVPTPLEFKRSFEKRFLAILAFGTLGSLLVYTQLPSTAFAPSSWAAFAGLGLGSFFFGHRSQ